MLTTLYIDSNKISSIHNEAFSGLEGKSYNHFEFHKKAEFLGDPKRSIYLKDLSYGRFLL